MDTALALLGLLYLPVLLVCAAFYGAGRAVTHETLGRVLRQSAVFWLIALWTVFTLTAIADVTCTNGYILSFQNCGLMPDAVAELSVLLTLFGPLAGGAYMTLLAIVGGYVEWRHRRFLKT